MSLLSFSSKMLLLNFTKILLLYFNFFFFYFISPHHSTLIIMLQVNSISIFSVLYRAFFFSAITYDQTVLGTMGYTRTCRKLENSNS